MLICKILGIWTARAVSDIDGPRRGRLAIAKNGNLILILPETTTSTMRLLRASKASDYSIYEEVWVGRGITGEPLIDNARLEAENVLSLFVKQDGADSMDRRDVAVLDFAL